MRPVGESGGLPGASSDKEGSEGESPAASKESAPEKAEVKKDVGGIDLGNIFEEEGEVDELLKDLADSEEEMFAEDLATQLREFLAELEKLTPS